MTDIGKIVLEALKELKTTMPLAVGKLASDRTFISVIEVKNPSQPVSINGKVAPVQYDRYVIIDCKKELPLDESDYIDHSEQLFTYFNTINKWYRA